MRPLVSPLTAFAFALAFLLTVPASAADLTAATKLVEARRWAEAQKAVEATARAGDPDAAYLLGRALFGQNRGEDAVEWLEKAAVARPKRSDYQMWLGRAMGLVAMQSSNPLRQASLAKKIKAQFEKAVALDAGNLDARRDLMLYYLQAPGFMGGSLEKAQQQAAAIAARDAVRGHQVKAEIHLHEKHPDLAVAELEQAIAKAPKDPKARVAHGMLLQELQRWDAAFATIEAGLAAAPDNYDLLYQMGRTGALSGRRLDQAAAALERCLAMPPLSPESPQHSGAHYRLGQIHEKRGDRAAARRHYQAALKLDPNLTDAKKALQKLG